MPEAPLSEVQQVASLSELEEREQQAAVERIKAKIAEIRAQLKALEQECRNSRSE